MPKHEFRLDHSPHKRFQGGNGQMHGNNVNNLMSFPLSSTKIKMTFFAQPSLLLNYYFKRETSNFLILLRHVYSTHSFYEVFQDTIFDRLLEKQGKLQLPGRILLILGHVCFIARVTLLFSYVSNPILAFKPFSFFLAKKEITNTKAKICLSRCVDNTK